MNSAHDESDLGSPIHANAVIAVNFLLEPDAVMCERAKADNARLLEVFPHGFALDDDHYPHVTLLQRFVHTGALAEVFAAADRAFASDDVIDVELEAIRYYYIPSGTIGLAGIVGRPHPALLALQARLIEAVAPMTAPTAGSEAFVTTPRDPVIDPQLIDYVAAFVPTSTGERFNPHVTTGIGPREYLDALLAAPFEPFTFSPAAAAVYQLGQYGTAARKLHGWSRSR